MFYAIAKAGFNCTRYLTRMSRDGFDIDTVTIFDDGSNQIDIFKVRRFKTQANADKALATLRDTGRDDYFIRQFAA
jgi:hypothetical protein